MSPRTLPAPALVLSPLKASAFLLGGIAVAIVITGCSPAEPEKNEPENQASSSAVASSEDQKAAVSSTKPESTTTEAVPAPKTAMSPKETFIQMKTEFDKIKTYADLETFIFKYGSEEQIAGMDKSANVYKGMILSHQKASGIRIPDTSLIVLSFSTESPPPLEESVLVVFGFVNNHWGLEITDFQRAF